MNLATSNLATSTGQRPNPYSFSAGGREEPLTPLRLLLTQFQSRYPTASLIAELLMIHDGNYVVRAIVQLGGTILVSGMAAAPDIELAEDRAKVRALEALTLNASDRPARLDSNPLERQLDSALSPPGLFAQLPFEQSNSELAASAVSDPIPSLDDLRQPDAPIETEIESQGELPADEPVLEPILVGATIAPIEFTSSSVSSWSDLPAPEPDTSHATTDLSDVIAQTTVELKRLGWTNAKGRTHLEQTYGKRSRQQLTDSELLDFLRYLESQHSPSQTPF